MKQVMSASILKNKRAQLSQSAILALICAVFLATSVFSVNPLNNAAERSAESLAASTTATLVVLAGINAFLSLAQEFEASITVATVQPLKTLEPVDDLVERVASALLIVTVSQSSCHLHLIRSPVLVGQFCCVIFVLKLGPASIRKTTGWLNFRMILTLISSLDTSFEQGLA